MAEKLLLEIVTPDRKLLSTEADVVVCPGVEGQFGILYGHVPFLSALDIGEMYYRDGGKTEYLSVSGGFAEVTGKKVTIVAESAEGPGNRHRAGPPGHGAGRKTPGRGQDRGNRLRPG
jgi:F-type H+-transporting ATPase subunit epsilon